MRHPLLRLAIAAMLWPAPAVASGYQSAWAADPGEPSIEIGIWYPSAAPELGGVDTPFGQALALDAPVAGDHLPLVLLSHGKGGWLGGHADTALALAKAGFVVVALTHPGDNRDDESAPASRWMVDRPRHVARVLDFMLGSWAGAASIDAGRVGIFGFSAGAYTALVAIGGVPDMHAAVAHCSSDPEELACALGVARDFPRQATPVETWTHDPRIKAAVLAAPGGGFAFAGDALSAVKVPVQLWAAAEDLNVPNPSNADVVRRSLPTPPEFRLVAGAGHFAFLQPCNPKLQEAAPEVWAKVCIDLPGFDRAGFHRSFNEAVVSFFNQNLSR